MFAPRSGAGGEGRVGGGGGGAWGGERPRRSVFFRSCECEEVGTLPGDLNCEPSGSRASGPQNLLIPMCLLVVGCGSNGNARLSPQIERSSQQQTELGHATCAADQAHGIAVHPPPRLRFRSPPPPGCLSTERSLQYRHTRELELQQTVCCRFGSAMPMAALAASTVSFRVLWIWEVKLFQRHLQFW
jgi:hypothetical protein